MYPTARKGNAMTVLDQVQDAPAQEQTKQQPDKASRLSAAVEAAYILDAVRK